MFVDRPELINIIIRLTNWELNLGRTNFVDHYTTDPKNQEEEKKKNDIIIIIIIIYHVTRKYIYKQANTMVYKSFKFHYLIFMCYNLN